MVWFSMSQETFNASDTVIKILGVGALIVSGIFAYTQYKDGQQREFKKAYFEKQLNAVDSLFEVMTQLESAKTEEEQSIYVKKFFSIYQGSGQRTFYSFKWV